jgi:hypothetical protein
MEMLRKVQRRIQAKSSRLEIKVSFVTDVQVEHRYSCTLQVHFQSIDNILVAKPDGKKILGKPRRRW